MSSTPRRSRKTASAAAASGPASAWMAARGWQPFGFQHEVWQALGEGRSGLLHATTGAGKTYAVWLGALQHLAHTLPVRAEPVEARAQQCPPAPVPAPLGGAEAPHLSPPTVRAEPV
ncbi:hypothetical protein, partial [Paracidovorax sp. MALMAid1276]|uniref:hypothetical protein n=1 Tax=Paracidovorax sp. MALMAid1276 TaxID=3411631 RepID=UPI003B9BC339